jgi:spermidine synthase
MSYKPLILDDTNLWFHDAYSKHTGLAIHVKEEIAHTITKFQQVRILDTFEFGKILVLNQFMYNAAQGTELTEMITHVPMNTGKNQKKNILLIGGGDGITLSQLVKYPEIEHIDLIDIDEELTQLCRQHFIVGEHVWSDPRIVYHFVNGYDFVEQSQDKYDLIIPVLSEIYNADGSEGMAFRLYTQAFFDLVKSHLTPDGIFISEGTTVHYTSPGYEWHTFNQTLPKTFNIVKPYHFNSKRIPGGEFVLIYCSETLDPIKDYALRSVELNTNYYNSAIHTAAFALPEHMQQVWNNH